MIPIVFSTDHNYVMPAGVTILSLLENADGESYDIFILAAQDVNDNDKMLLRRQVETASPSSKISFLSMGDSFNGCYEIRGISKASYYRLLIPWLIPQYDKIIYSDVDIIFQNNLREVYDIDLTGFYLSGVNTPGSKAKSFVKHLTSMQLEASRYINAGFLVINAAYQRQSSLNNRFLELSKNNYTYQDQDIINIACDGKILLLDDKWNVGPFYCNDNHLLSNMLTMGGVIHYAGAKPWKEFTFGRDLWWGVYLRSIFRDNRYYYECTRTMMAGNESVKTLVKKLLKRCAAKLTGRGR